MRIIAAILFTFLASNFVAQVAQAQVEATNESSLKALLGSQAATVKAGEDRTFYFAADSDQSIEVSSINNVVYLAMNQTDSQSLGAELSQGKSNQVLLSAQKRKGTLLQVDQLVDVDGHPALYSQVKFSVHLRESQNPNSLSLEVSGVEKKLMGYKYDGQTSKPVMLEQPEIKRAKLSGRFILSLSQADVDALGDKAVKNLSEDRTADSGTCTMQSESVMQCSFSLATDYTPDTLHATYSIKDGKITELVETSVEPGC
jgi:hypothetical protein